MERYYSDKYSLDDYSPKSNDRKKSAPSRRRAASGTRRRPARAKTEDKPQRERQQKRGSGKKPTRVAPKGTRRRAPKKKMSKGKKVLVAVIAVIIIGGIAATACVVGLNMYRDYKKTQPFRFSDNVKIGGISVGGMSYEDAEAKLKENKLTMVHNFELAVVANGEKRKYSKYDFEYKFNFKTPLDTAKTYSLKEQGIYDEPETIPKTTEATAESESDENSVDFTVKYAVVPDSVKKQVKLLGREVDVDPVNAEVTAFHPFSAKRFSYKKGQEGYMLHQDELLEDMLTFISSGNANKKIIANVETLTPEISVNDLRQNIVGLSTASSTSYNNQNANTNMAVALKACNGSIIKPGETWSFNEHTGDSNLESNGYKKATVIVEGKYEEGVGGGICQSSTTIFKAAVFANAAIIERNNHFWASDYAYAGEDATIDYPNLDLRFQNTTKYPMFLECKMEGSVLTANIWGIQEDYYDNVKLTSENYDIKKDDSYRTVTKRYLYLNGEVVNEEEICYSFYSLTDGHSMRDDDKGSFRTTVDGVCIEEVDKTPDTTEQSSE